MSAPVLYEVTENVSAQFLGVIVLKDGNENPFSRAFTNEFEFQAIYMTMRYERPFVAAVIFKGMTAKEAEPKEQA